MLGGVGREEQMEKGKQRGRDEHNEKAIVFLRRCEKLAVFSELREFIC